MLNVGTRARARERDERGIAHVWTSDFSVTSAHERSAGSAHGSAGNLAYVNILHCNEAPRTHDLRQRMSIS